MLQRVYDDLRNNNEVNKIVREKEIIFSNIRLRQKVKNNIFSLEPIYVNTEINTYLLEYKYVGEDDGAGRELNPMARKELVEEIIIILTLFFKGVFITDKEYLQKLLRNQPETINDTTYPRRVCKYIFEPQVHNDNFEYETWDKFFEAYIQLNIGSYKKIISAIKQYYTGLMTMSFNLEITYASFVAIMESLTQKLDRYENIWEDVYEPQRIQLDKKFSDMNANDVDDIKNILLTYSHNKLAKRYKEFCRSKVDNNYFLRDAEGVASPCLKREINQCIDNSYDIRSRYVHELEELPQKFLWTYESETVDIDDRVYFTIQGLVRFVRYGLIKTISEEDKTDDTGRYKDELLPGVIVIPLIEGFAPQHWICDTTAFNISNLHKYFNGILSIYADIFRGNKKELPPLFNVCSQIEKLIGGTHQDNQTVLLVIYKLFYDLIREEERSTKYQKINDKYGKLLNAPSMPALVYNLLFGIEVPWSIEETKSIYEVYCKKYYNKASIRLPNFIENIILAHIIKGIADVLEYKKYLEELVGINPGNAYLQSIYNKYIDDQIIPKVDMTLIYKDIN